MARPRAQSSQISALGTACFGCAAMATMVWTICTDLALANVCWPTDIHRSVVGLLGGDTQIAINGETIINLSWLSVLLRVTLSLGGLTAFAAILERRFQKNLRSDATSGSSSIAGFVSTSVRCSGRIAFPCLFSAAWLLVWFLAEAYSDIRVLAFIVTTTPVCLALIVAGMINSCFDCHPSKVPATGSTAASFGSGSIGNSGASRSWWPEFAIVVLAMLAWEATSFWMNERLYAGLLVPHGDSAMYEEHLWNVWHGKGFRSYLDQGLFLGEHIQVIHLLLLPLHMLWPSYLMMEFCASASLAICAIPLFSIARRHSGSSRAAMWLSLAWLLFFPMHYLDIAIDIKTLRPSCYGLPFLFWGIDFAERRKLTGSSLFFLIALSTQEDFSLIVGSIGLVLFLVALRDSSDGARRRMLQWSAGVLLFSVAYLLLAVLVVIPGFRGGAVVHYSRYFGDLGNSPGDLIRTAIQDPTRILKVLVSFRTLGYLIVLTAPLGCLAWRKPIYLLAGVPTFVMLSLIQLGNEAGPGVDASGVEAVSQLPPVPYHHFHAPLLPVLFWAAAVALKSPRSVRLARFAFWCALGTAMSGSMMPIGTNFWSETSSYGWRSLYVPGDRAAEFSKILEQIPLSSRVASTDYVHTRLTHFERSYDYSGYLRAVNNYQPGVPDDTDYIVIDTSHPYSSVRSLADVRELKVEPEKWDVLPDDTNGLFIVLKRRR